jgi:hypothetical protein
LITSPYVVPWSNAIATGAAEVASSASVRDAHDALAVDDDRVAPDDDEPRGPRDHRLEAAPGRRGQLGAVDRPATRRRDGLRRRAPASDDHDRAQQQTHSGTLLARMRP